MRQCCGWLLLLVGPALLGCDRATPEAAAADPFSDLTKFDNAATSGDVALGVPLRKPLANFGPSECRDVALLQATKNAAVILINDGAGVFSVDGMFGTIDLGAEPVSVAAADLDDDGDVDLAIACRGARNVVRMLINDGAGRLKLEPALDVLLPGVAGRILAGQFNDISHGSEGDMPTGARIDLAVAVKLDVGAPAGALLILRNEGGGRFVAAQTMTDDRGATATSVIDDIDSGDLDNDKDIDIVIVAGSGRTSSVRVMENLGAEGGWAFREAARFAVHGEKSQLALLRVCFAEFNGDPSVDLVVTGEWHDGSGLVSNSLVALNGGGVGDAWRGFQAPLPIAGTESCETVAGQLFTGQPWLRSDLIAIRNDGALYPFRNKTDLSVVPPKFELEIQTEKPAAGAIPRGASLVELTGDGQADLLVTTGYFKRTP